MPQSSLQSSKKVSENAESVDYGSKTYWDTRYGKDSINETEGFEWFVTFKDIEPLLERHISKSLRASCSVCDLGCGDSSFLFDLENSGFCGKLMGIDYSSVVVKAMTEQSKKRGSKVEFSEGDVTSLQFESETVDVFVDKSTMDALLHHSSGEENVDKMVREVSRCLKPGGFYILVTQMSPMEEDDMEFFSDSLVPCLDDQYNWTVDAHCTDAVGGEEDSRGIQVFVFQKGVRHSMRLRSGRSKGRLVMRTHYHGTEDEEE